VTAVAIVIPTLNRAPLLRGAIASALRCEPAPAEILVVDCGSTDDTASVARSFGDDVALIERRLPNAAAARNVGLAETHSPYVGFLDSDDEALPGKTGDLAAVLDAHADVALAHGRMEVMEADGTSSPSRTSRLDGDRERAQKAGTDYAALASACLMYTSATLMRRDALEQIDGFDESLGTYEDWDLYLRLSLSWRLEYASAPAARYRIWSGNVPWDRTAAGLCEVAEKHLDMLHALPEEMRAEAEWGLRRRLASSRYTLVELRKARGAAWRAFRTDPVRAISDPDLRRVLTRAWLPTGIIERRRDERSR
jgi:glycosyltransferase involved in cell wall biosynthesis